MDVKQLIRIIKAKTGHDQEVIANQLGINRSTLSRKISAKDDSIFNLIAAVYKNELSDIEISPSTDVDEETILLSASVKMLNEEVATLKAKNEKISYDLALSKMKERANSILKDLF